MTQHRDFFNRVLEPGDRVLVFKAWGDKSFRVAEVVRFTDTRVVITRDSKSMLTKALYVKPKEIIKMTEEMEMLNSFRMLTK